MTLKLKREEEEEQKLKIPRDGQRGREGKKKKKKTVNFWRGNKKALAKPRGELTLTLAIMTYLHVDIDNN